MTNIRTEFPVNILVIKRPGQTSQVTHLAPTCLGLEDVLRCGEVRLLGEIIELELEEMLLGEVDTEPDTEPDLMLLEEACLS